jgi:hypothetical protein
MHVVTHALVVESDVRIGIIHHGDRAAAPLRPMQPVALA